MNSENKVLPNTLAGPSIMMTFDHKFRKCRPISKILSMSDSWGNFVHIRYQDSPPHLNRFNINTWKFQIAGDFNGVLHVHETSDLQDTRLLAALIAHVWILWNKMWKTTQ